MIYAELISSLAMIKFNMKLLIRELITTLLKTLVYQVIKKTVNYKTATVNKHNRIECKKWELKILPMVRTLHSINPWQKKISKSMILKKLLRIYWSQSRMARNWENHISCLDLMMYHINKIIMWNKCTTWMISKLSHKVVQLP